MPSHPVSIHSLPTTSSGAHGIPYKGSVSRNRCTSRSPAIVDEVLGSPGNPLDHASRQFFGSGFGQDLENIRVHTDLKAAQSARSVAARAYTVENHIVFGTNQFSPSSPTGRRLIAHEIAHAIQHNKMERPYYVDKRIPGKRTLAEDPNGIRYSKLPIKAAGRRSPSLSTADLAPTICVYSSKPTKASRKRSRIFTWGP
jgi:hypothetical protein